MDMSLIKKINLKSCVEIIGSRWFFIAVIAVFVLGAAWLALGLDAMGNYDEGYHLYIISIYKDHLSPIITTQNQAWDVVGDVTRLPSYLYHYLMSWPLKVIALFIGDAHMQVFVLRLINVGIFAAGLLAYRRVLLRIGLGKALANICILFVSLIPLTVQLAATISYDNLLFLVSGITLLVFIKLINEKKINYATLATFIILGLLGALVKYTFLPLYLPLFIFAAVTIIRRDGRNTFQRIGLAAQACFRQQQVVAVILSVLIVLSAGLFVERYGVNLVRYHSMSPNCEKLMSRDRCAKYYVWQRNDSLLASRNDNRIDSDIFVYAGQWVKGMSTTPFFPHRIQESYTTTLTGPLPIPVRTYQVLMVLGAVVMIMGFGILAQNRARLYLLLMGIFYTAVLFMDNYNSYLTYHAPVATSGRYLLIILPLFIGSSAYVLRNMLARYKTAYFGIGVVSILLMLQGGGAITDIVRSPPSWFWNPDLYTVNTTIKKVIDPFIKENDWL
jgi:hypothetical protein